LTKYDFFPPWRRPWCAAPRLGGDPPVFAFFGLAALCFFFFFFFQEAVGNANTGKSNRGKWMATKPSAKYGRQIPAQNYLSATAASRGPGGGRPEAFSRPERRTHSSQWVGSSVTSSSCFELIGQSERPLRVFRSVSIRSAMGVRASNGASEILREPNTQSELRCATLIRRGRNHPRKFHPSSPPRRPPRIMATPSQDRESDWKRARR